MERNRVSPPRWVKNVLLGAGLILAQLVGSDVSARIGKIPPPPAKAPPEGKSPATGQPAPADPKEPPPIAAPEGKPCKSGPDQRECDPDHPGSPEGKKPGNKPPDAWYTAMAGEMYDLQQGLEKVSNWSSRHESTVHYYSEWLQSVTQQYYESAYHDGVPRQYPFGRMTRGDFNYILFYWVQPIYYNLLYQASEYYRSHSSESHISEYKSAMKSVSSAYHGLVKCNYGFNGEDSGALEDSEAQEFEATAGISAGP
jgi:hypothetical protein